MIRKVIFGSLYFAVFMLAAHGAAWLLKEDVQNVKIHMLIATVIIISTNV